METNFNFKSSVCTTREQSERLLALGLKKETADMKYLGTREYYGGVFTEGTSSLPIIIDTEDDDITEYEIPAWSLHRLIEMIPKNIIVNIDMVFPFRRTALMDLIDNDCDLFEGLVQIIERGVKEGYFNKEYLAQI